MRLFTLIVLIHFSITLCFAQSAAKREVLQAEKDRFAAQVTKNYAVLDKTIGDDLYYIHSNGDTDTKDTFIQGIRDGSRSYNDITMEETKVRVYHGKTAVINGLCTYFRTAENGQPNNLRLRYTNVYVKRGKQWQMVAWQSYRMP
jgi:ketosteroid isomerase-like protein